MGGGSQADDRCADCCVRLVVQVDVKEIFNRDLPPLTDDIADQLYPGAKTLAEVRSPLQRFLPFKPFFCYPCDDFWHVRVAYPCVALSCPRD